MQALTPAALKALAQIVKDKRQSGQTRVMAAQVILDRAWGKPEQAIAIAKTSLVDMSDAELLAIIATSMDKPVIEGEVVEAEVVAEMPIGSPQEAQDGQIEVGRHRPSQADAEPASGLARPSLAEALDARDASGPALPDVASDG